MPQNRGSGGHTILDKNCLAAALPVPLQMQTAASRENDHHHHHHHNPNKNSCIYGFNDYDFRGEMKSISTGAIIKLLLFDH